MIVFASCVADEEKFRRCAAPGLGLAMEDDAAFVRVAHPSSLFVAYNGVLDAIAGHDDVEALVLLHEDTEIRDPRFASVVRARIAARSLRPSRTLPPVSITATALLPMTNPTLAIAPSFSAVMSARAPVWTKTPLATSVTARGCAGSCPWATTCAMPHASIDAAAKVAIGMQYRSVIARAAGTPGSDKYEL